MGEHTQSPRVVRLGSHLLVSTGSYELIALCCHEKQDVSSLGVHQLLVDQRVSYFATPEWDGSADDLVDTETRRRLTLDDLGDFPRSLKLSDIENWAFSTALVREQGSVVRAARLLGVTRKTVQNWRKRHG